MGFDYSQAWSINNSGQIVGWVQNFPSSRAVLFDPTGNGDNINLGTLGGDESMAWFISDLGQIIGWANDSSGDSCATLFDPTGNGNNIDLNTLIDPASGWTLQTATSINNSGWIVGGGLNPAGEIHAYLLVPEPVSIVLLGLGVLFLKKRR